MLFIVIRRTLVRFPTGRPWSCIFRNWFRFGPHNVYVHNTHNFLDITLTFNIYTYSLKTGVDISTPNNFHVEKMQYLCTSSETCFDISTPNHFPCKICNNYPHGLNLVSRYRQQIIFMSKISNNYPHGLKLVSIYLHQVIFMSKISNIYPHGQKLVSIYRHQIIFM